MQTILPLVTCITPGPPNLLVLDDLAKWKAYQMWHECHTCPDSWTTTNCQKTASPSLPIYNKQDKWHACQKWQEYLNSLIKAARQANDVKKQKLILHLKWVEQNQQYFQLVKSYIKPQSAGRLSKLIVPTTRTMEDVNQHQVIHKPELIDQHLLAYCKIYFDQAHGSPFIIPPLSMLVGYDGLTPLGHQVLHQTVDLDPLPLSHQTKLFLKHQQYCTPLNQPIFHEMPYNQLMNGFKWWRNVHPQLDQVIT